VELRLNAATADYLKQRRRIDVRVINPALASIVLLLVDRVNEARTLSEQVTDETVDYLFGEYAGTSASEPTWRNVSWMSVFEYSLWCGATTGAWDSIARICSYVREDLRVDFEHTEDERAFYLAVAACFSGETGRCSQLLTVAQACSSGEYRLAAQTLAAIQAGDVAAFSDGLRHFLERFIKSASVRNKSDVTRTISTVGTFLYHYGIHKGLAAPQLPPALMDRIVIFDTDAKGN
jgi:hypothetical protein